MYTMIEPELPIANEIAEPLLEIVVAESTTIENERRVYRYHANVREISFMLTIIISITIVYILYICLHGV
jgi:hypothetical protein